MHTGETPYKCVECDLKFNNRSAHRYHLELKHSNEEFLCLHCSKTFQTRQCLRKHLIISHGKKMPPKIPGRRKKAAGADKVKKKKKPKKKVKVKKIKQETVERVAVISEDGTVVFQEGVIVQGGSGDSSVAAGDSGIPEGTVLQEGDIIEINGEQRVVLTRKKQKKKKKDKKKKSKKRKVSGDRLRKPLKTAHLVRAHQCEFCPGQYTLRKNLFKHIRSKHPDKAPPKGIKTEWSCDYCGIVMKTKTYKREHERIHTGERPFRCRLGCVKTFTRTGARNEHERSVHLKENKATCEVCNKSFDRRELRHHITIHTGEKPFRCPYCQNSYTQKKIMNKHIRRTHPGCEVPAPMPRKRTTPVKKVVSTLDHHMMANLGMNSDAMTVSTAASAPDESTTDQELTVESLKKRILQEAADGGGSGTVEMQVFKCKYCEKFFNNTEHLTNHENVHIQTKHYQCGTCGKSTSRDFAIEILCKTPYLFCVYPNYP